MLPSLPSALGTALIAVLAAGCGEPTSQSVATGGAVLDLPAEWPGKDDPRFLEGRTVWLNDCENCHGIGKAGSPKFGDPEAWASRLAKGESVLIASAINGFEGRTEAGMPPRGGNEELTDEQVSAAVRYMMHFSRSDIGSAADQK